MLEYWYKDRRALLDFRRGPLGNHFDGFAEYLKQRGCSQSTAKHILGKSCLFNIYLMDNGIRSPKEISPSLIDPFMDEYLANFRTTSESYSVRHVIRGQLNQLFKYLFKADVLRPIKSKPKKARYSWVLEPYLLYMREERELSQDTIRKARAQLSPFLEGLGENVLRKGMKTLTAETIEAHIHKHLNETPENLRRIVSTLRQFFRFCAREKYTSRDFSGMIPSIPKHRYTSIPKGMEDSALQHMINGINRDTQKGARDYAVLLLLMAYGIRGKQVAELLLEDISWKRSTIRVRPLKGGKEVILPLMDAVGEAIIQYLHYRPESQFKEVFLSIKAPIRPLSGLAICQITRQHMTTAGVKVPGSGSSTLRHSWAIRALADNSSIKSIADVFGHRCINTTFIYAKADLNTLRQVAMPWPERR